MSEDRSLRKESSRDAAQQFVCDWNPKPHRFCGGPGKREAMPDSRARYVEGHWYLPVEDYHELRAELERERHDAWEALDGTNVKALRAENVRLRAAIQQIAATEFPALPGKHWTHWRVQAQGALDEGVTT